MSAVIHTVLPMPACLMKARRSAISISRPRGLPSPCAIASPLTTPIGKSAAMIFHVACELINSRLSQEVGERLGELGFLLSDDIPPHLAVRKLALRVKRTVGVNVVATMNEKIGPRFQHGRIGAHTPARLVDAPATARGIARPHERDGAPFARRRAK